MTTPTAVHPTKKVAQARSSPSPSLATEGNPGRLILPHGRTGVLLTVPGQLETPTKRIDGETTDNKTCWESTLCPRRAPRKYSSSLQDGGSFLSPRGSRWHCLRKLLFPLEHQQGPVGALLHQIAKQTKRGPAKAPTSKLALGPWPTKVDTTCVLT